MNELSKIIVMSFVSIAVLFVLSKILGKRQIAQLEFIDYVIGISIGSIASEMATDLSDKPMWAYILAMVIYFLVDIMFMMLSKVHPKLKHFFKGTPLTLIKDGKIDNNELLKSKLDVNDLLALLRDKGFFDIRTVNCAVLENNGSLSVLPTENYEESSSYAFIPTYLVVDGRIVKKSLNKLDKDENWLLSTLEITDKKQLKNLLLVLFDKEENSITCYHKNM